MKIEIVKDKISIEKVKESAQASFGDMVKIAVDINKEIMAIGGEMHADGEALLLENGSNQNDLWGANIYINSAGAYQIEYESFINIRPSQNNKSMKVEDEKIKEKIKKVVDKLIG